MIVGTSVAVGGILFAAAPLLMQLMGAQGEFARLAVQYLQVYALCSPVTTIIFAVDNYLRICGYIRGSMFLNILMSLLCGLLEILFLDAFWLGRVGSGTCRMYRHVSLRADCSYPVFPRKKRCCASAGPVFTCRCSDRYLPAAALIFLTISQEGLLLY